MKRFLAALILSAFFAVTLATARGGILIGAGLQVLTQTNSSVFATNYAALVVPPLTLSITGITNGATICTNRVSSTINVNGTVFTAQYTFVFSAAGSTADFTTNFPTMSYIITNATRFECIPQSGGSNTFNVSVVQ